MNKFSVFNRFALLVTALALTLPALPAAANVVTFDFEPLGTSWGGAFGDSPGDLALSEDAIDMYVEEFHLGAFTAFSQARIDPAPASFGSVQVLSVNNIALRFDFSGVDCAPGPVSFEFADQGGDENLQVNGGPLYEVPDLTVLDGLVVAPGVTCHVAAGMVGGTLIGTVTLDGPVDKFLTGGQEFFIDDVRMDCGPPVDPCDFLVSHDFLPVGTCWGGGGGDLPGDLMFTEDGIPVTLQEFHLGGYVGFISACIVDTFCGMGDLRALSLNNISAVYQIHALGIPVGSVSFEFIDQGGDENLRVNGATWYEVPDLTVLDGIMVAPGVLCSVSTWPCDGGIRGLVTLTGHVDRLLVGGQEFFVDEVCVHRGEEPVDCDLLVDMETLPLGMAWGGPHGDAPGDFMFEEDGIPAFAGRIFYAGGGTGFDEAAVIPAFSDCLESQILQLANIAAIYEIGAAVAATDLVTFDFLDYGGTENLQVNGAAMYIGDIHLAPAAIAPGVTCTVTTWDDGAGGMCGHVTLVGDVQTLRVAGQEFWMDNLCVVSSTTGVGEQPEAARPAALEPAFPNPFNPKTTLRFSLPDASPVRLTVHDVLGREVAVLVDGPLAAGEHALSWEGRDDAGRPLASGVYFARLRAENVDEATKLVLTK